MGWLLKRLRSYGYAFNLKVPIGDCENLNYNFRKSKDCRKSFEIDAYLGLNANGNGEAFYHNGHRLAAQSFLVGKDKFQETQPEDSYFRYIGYIDLLNDYTPGSYDFSDPCGEIRFRNDCKIRMKDNSVETLVPFTQTSDGRTKTNKEEIRSGLDAILRLKPQTYQKDGKTESGFITQEVLEIPELKHLVNVPENENELQSLNYTGIISYLVSAIQELNNKLN